MIGPDGTTRFLEGGRTLRPASLSAPRFVSAHDRLTEDDALLHTDGLVERRGTGTDLLALAQRCHRQTLGQATWANSRIRSPRPRSWSAERGPALLTARGLAASP